MQIKKYFCLVLSAILLFTNGQVFAQNAEQFSEIISPYEIEELEMLASRVSLDYSRSAKHISSNISYLDYSLSDKCIIKNTNPYSSDFLFANSLGKYEEDMYAFQRSLEEFQTKIKTVYQKYIDALPEGTYLKRATETYINRRMNDLFETQNRYVNNFLNWTDKIVEEQSHVVDLSKYLDLSRYNEKAKAARLKEFYLKDTGARNYFMRDLAEAQKYYEKAFTWDLEKLMDQLKAANASFNKETIEFFAQKTHTAEEILEYFLKHGPKEQKAILFSLKTTEQGLTTTHLIPYLRYYLKHTNRRLWKLEKYSAENLSRTIAHMTFAQKTEYIDNLLDFAPEAKALRQEIRTAEHAAGKKILNRNSIKLGGTFMLIGSALIALTITEIAANNNFKQSNINKLAETKNKINEGEILPLNDIVDYFTDERNQAELAQNPLALTEAFEAIQTVNILLDNSGMDLSANNDDTQKSVEYKISDTINTGINNFNPYKISSKVGVLEI